MPINSVRNPLLNPHESQLASCPSIHHWKAQTQTRKTDSQRVITILGDRWVLFKKKGWYSTVNKREKEGGAPCECN